MDLIKIGKFLADLRRENNLTQEQLGEEIGVTNKTISRWENGNYLPPVEILQILSNKYGLTINEILSGERLDGDNYKAKAEENIAVALNNSAFSVQDKQKYFRRKWEKDHLVEMIIEILVLVAAAILGAIYCKEVSVASSFICLIWAYWINNRRAAYIERHVFENHAEKSEDNHTDTKE